MALTSNIHIGLAAYASGQTLSVGDRRNNGGNAYQATTAGTVSGSGPTHTSGTVGGWKWLSSVDYTSLAAWAAAIPTTLVQSIIGLLWNDGEIQHTSNPLLSLAGHTTTSTYFITLQCAPGESFSDALTTDSSKTLDYNSVYGVAIKRTGSGNYSTVFSIGDNYTIIKGLQFNDEGGYGKTALSITGTNVNLDSCIISGDALGGRIVAFSGANWTIQNCLITITTNNGAQIPVYGNSNGITVNTTFVNKGTANLDRWIRVQYATVVCKNNMAFGPAATIVDGLYGVAGSWTYGVSDRGGFASGITTSNNNVAATLANQFINTASDFRLKTGADAIDFGTATGAPASDIVGTSRPQGTGYDAGAWERMIAVALKRPFVTMMG